MEPLGAMHRLARCSHRDSPAAAVSIARRHPELHANPTAPSATGAHPKAAHLTVAPPPCPTSNPCALAELLKLAMARSATPCW